LPKRYHQLCNESSASSSTLIFIHLFFACSAFLHFLSNDFRYFEKWEGLSISSRLSRTNFTNIQSNGISSKYKYRSVSHFFRTQKKFCSQDHFEKVGMPFKVGAEGYFCSCTWIIRILFSGCRSVSFSEREAQHGLDISCLL
jgi:hypothetical protein